MIWLPIEPSGEIKQWHDELDKSLFNGFGIPIDRMDMEFKPHISLFTKGQEKQLFEMKQRLNGIIEPMELTLNRFVVGSSRHGDEYFEV
jgi:2'-5' RNA ligase